MQSKTRRIFLRTSTAMGVTLICAGTINNYTQVMHADETVTSQQNGIDTGNWTAVDKAKTITRTIHFIDENGKLVAPDVIERHTGEIFSAKNGSDKRAFAIVNGSPINVIPKFTAVTSPTIRGFQLKDNKFKNIPEQGWSLDGTQTTDPKTGFYTNLAQDEVINVVYTKDNSQTDNSLQNAVPVAGYTVLNVKTLTRTINYVDGIGNKLATSVVESVKYETVAPSSLTPKEQNETKNQKVAIVNVIRDTARNITTQNTHILSTPAYRLKDVASPKINGYKLQNRNFKTLSGQYMWLSDKPYVHAILDNGLPQYMVQDEIVDVVYVPGKETNGKENSQNSSAITGNDKTDKNNSNDSENKSNDGSSSRDAKNNSTNNYDNTSSTNTGLDDNSENVLPQTGNTKFSTSLLGSGLALLFTAAIGYLSEFKKKI